MMLLAVTVPDQRRQEIGHLGVCGIEMHHGIEHVRLTHPPVTDGDREQFARMQHRTRHGEVLPLSQGTCGRQQTRNGA